MLNIYLGEMEGAVYHPPVYFDNRYEDEWLAEPLAIEMVKDVDKSEIISPHLVQSPVLCWREGTGRQSLAPTASLSYWLHAVKNG